MNVGISATVQGYTFLVQGFHSPYCYSYVILPLKLLLFQLYKNNRKTMLVRNKILKIMLRPRFK